MNDEAQIRQYKKRLSELEERLELLENNSVLGNLSLSLDDLPIGIYKTTMKGDIVYANHTLINLLGFDSLEEMQSYNAKDFYVVPELRMIQNTQFISNKFVADEHRFFRKDKSIIWIRDLARKVLGDDGIEYFEGTIEDITDRKRAHNKIQENEEKYRNLVETMVQGLALHEILINDEGIAYDYIFLDVNRAFEELTGLKKEHVIGRRVLEILPETEDYWIASYAEVALKGTTKHFINFHKGLGKYYEVAAYCPKKFKFAVIITDVTERVRIENALRESELKLRTLINSVPDIICFKDREGKWLETNNYNLSLFDLTEIDYHGKTDGDLAELVPFHSETFLNCVESDEVAWNLGVPSRADEVIPIHGGSSKVFDIIKVPLFEPDGSRKGLVVVGREITEKKNLEIALRESEKNYRVISEMLTDYVYMAKLYNDGRVVTEWIVGGFEKMTGYSFDEVNSRPSGFASIVHPEDIGEFLSNILPRIRNLEEISIEYRLIHKSGEIRWINDHVKPYTDPLFPGVICEIGAATDVTDKKQAEIALREYTDKLKVLNDQKDKFFSIIAHDLRSPLSAFLGLSRLISEQARHLTPNELEEFASNMAKSASNIYNLLENLLEWSKIQRGLVSFNKVPTSLGSLIELNISLYFQQYAEKEILLEAEIPSDIIAKIDVQMINTILRNLITNAYKFTNRGGRVLIGLYTVGSNALITVTDSGIGIAEENISKLFDLGQKFSRLGTEDEPSSGLGLQLSKDFIELHGGRIWVESEFGIGSKFSVELPIE